MSLLPTCQQKQAVSTVADGQLPLQAVCRAYFELFVCLADGLAVRLLSPTVAIFAKKSQSLSVEKKHTATCDVCQFCIV